MNLQSRSFRGGFTLLELIFALSMVAMIIPMLVGSLTGDFRLKADTVAAVEPPRTAEAALDWLRQDFGDAVPPSTATTTLQGPFEGTTANDDRGRRADDVVFCGVADAPQHADVNGDIKVIELTMMTAPNGDHVLVRKVTSDVIGYENGTAAEPDVEVLCRGVDGFMLRYFDGSAWVDSWDSTAENNTLPAAVEVTITLDRPNVNGAPSKEGDGTPCFQFTRVIAIPCSTAAFDSTVNSGTVQ